MTEIDGDYLVTDETSVAVLFLDCVIDLYGTDTWFRHMRLHSVGRKVFYTQFGEYSKVRIPRAVVLELIEHVKGEAAVWDGDDHDDLDGVRLLSADEAAYALYADSTKYNWRLVNICQDYGELRKLVEWAKK